MGFFLKLFERKSTSIENGPSDLKANLKEIRSSDHSPNSKVYFNFDLMINFLAARTIMRSKLVTALLGQNTILNLLFLSALVAEGEEVGAVI
jgi:hypothetical protein